jgi:transcriptional regulator with XRE-family HTH domain
MSKPIEACHQAFGLRVRMIRETLGQTQDDVAKKVGLKRTSVTNIVLLDDVETFAQALGVSPKHLLKGIWW